MDPHSKQFLNTCDTQDTWSKHIPHGIRAIRVIRVPRNNMRSYLQSTRNYFWTRISQMTRIELANKTFVRFEWFVFQEKAQILAIKVKLFLNTNLTDCTNHKYIVRTIRVNTRDTLEKKNNPQGSCPLYSVLCTLDNSSLNSQLSTLNVQHSSLITSTVCAKNNAKV